MYERAAVLSLYAETPLHPGRGAAVGAVDLPVQRERYLDYPLIPGSSLKGVLRAQARLAWRDRPGTLAAIFGPDTEAASLHAGALALTDARLLLFPVRSLHGVFAWTTSPLALERYQRDLTAAGLGVSWTLPAVDGQALVSPGSALAQASRVTLEEFTLPAREAPDVASIAQDLATNVLPDTPEYASWRDRLPRQLAILPDDEFRDFVQTATDVVARIRVDPGSGTVASGGLWYEEQIPPETVFYALALASLPRRPANGQAGEPRSAADVLEALAALGLDRLQVGGDEGVGRGIVKARLRQPEARP